MNYTPSAVPRTDDLHQALLPGLEHIDLRHDGNHLGGSLIGELIAAVRQKALGLALWILLCFSIGLSYAVTAQPEFVANAQVVLEPRVRLPPGADAAAAASAAAPILDSAQAESQLQIVRSARNLRYVFDTLNLASDPAYADKGPGLIGRLTGGILALVKPAAQTLKPGEAELRAREIAFQNFSNRVQVRRLGQSYVMDVSFRGLTPADTTRITNSIAAAYIRDQVLVRAVSEQRGTEYLQGRITLIQAEKKAADEAVATGVITDFQFPDSDARIVGAAQPPLGASYPQTKLIVLLMVIFGLISGSAAIAVLNNFDRTVRSPAQIRRFLEIDCLVFVPRFRFERLSDVTVLTQPDSDFAIAMRLLRAVLFAVGTKSGHTAIGLVGCQGGEGCTALSANLAHLLAVSGSSLTLVDANLSKPDLTRRFAPEASSGLDGLVLSPLSGVDLPEVQVTPTLNIVPAIGAIATGRKANPNAFLGSQAMRASIARLSSRRDLILDLPALDVSSDAQAIGHMLSGVVLVATLNRTKLDQLSDAVRALHSSNTRVLGIVLNDAPPARHVRRMVPASMSSNLRNQAEPKTQS